jgi:hypothetical protein
VVRTHPSNVKVYSDVLRLQAIVTKGRKHPRLLYNPKPKETSIAGEVLAAAAQDRESWPAQTRLRKYTSQREGMQPILNNHHCPGGGHRRTTA